MAAILSHSANALRANETTQEQRKAAIAQGPLGAAAVQDAATQKLQQPSKQVKSCRRVMLHELS